MGQTFIKKAVVCIDFLLNIVHKADSVALNVISLSLTRPANGVVSDHRSQNLTFDLLFRPSPGAAEVINKVEFDRYEVTAYMYLASPASTSNSTWFTTQVISLTPAQGSADELYDGGVTLLSDLVVTFDLSQVSCGNFGPNAPGPDVYLCAELFPSADAAYWFPRHGCSRVVGQHIDARCGG